MELTIHNITYNVTEQDGLVTFTKPNGTITTAASSIKEAVSNVFIREYRDRLILKSDWRMVSDYPYSDQEEWATYRQTLRELPNNYVVGSDVAFPTPPIT